MPALEITKNWFGNTLSPHFSIAFWYLHVISGILSLSVVLEFSGIYMHRLVRSFREIFHLTASGKEGFKIYIEQYNILPTLSVHSIIASILN